MPVQLTDLVRQGDALTVLPALGVSGVELAPALCRRTRATRSRWPRSDDLQRPSSFDPNVEGSAIDLAGDLRPTKFA